MKSIYMSRELSSALSDFFGSKTVFANHCCFWCYNCELMPVGLEGCLWHGPSLQRGRLCSSIIRCSRLLNEAVRLLRALIKLATRKWHTHVTLVDNWAVKWWSYPWHNGKLTLTTNVIRQHRLAYSTTSASTLRYHKCYSLRPSLRD